VTPAAAGSCPEPGRRTPAPAPRRAGSPRCWSRTSTTRRCTRCGPRWRHTPRGPGCPRAGPRTWSWWCTSWPPTRSGTAPGTAGCGYGRRQARCAARSPTTARPGRRTRTRRSGPPSPVTGCGWPGRSPTRPAWIPGRPAPSPRWASPCGPPGDPAPPGLARRFQHGCVIVTVTGQLDLGSSGRLTRAVGGLARATPGLRLVLDLSGLTGWDSCGLAALITAQRQIDAVPAARMVLAGLPARLARQLHDAGHAGRFTVADTTAGAIRIASSA